MALLVEGNLDEAVGRRIIEHAGGNISVVYGKAGAGYIENKLVGFNKLAKGHPLLTLLDLMDTDSDCPAQIVRDRLPRRQENMLFRLVVREIESWILADRAGIARFLGVPKRKISPRPEQLDDPKRYVVNLARRSRYPRIRRLLVPLEGSTATEGPAYTSEIQNFVRDKWDLDEAAQRSPSLARCMAAVTGFLARASE